MPDLLHIPIPGQGVPVGKYRVSLYEPKPLAAVSGDFEAADESFLAVPSWTNVPAFYEPTPEFTNVNPIGLTKEENVFTSDKWWFLADQPLNDAWLIVLTAYYDRNYRGSGRQHPLAGRGWITQGNNTVIEQMNRSWIFSKLSPTSVIPAQG